MTEKQKRKIKNQVPCPTCDRTFMNSGAVRIHAAHCKGKAGKGAETPKGKTPPSSNGEPPRHPPQPRGNTWDPLGMQ